MPVTINIEGENAGHALAELKGLSAGLVGHGAAELGQGVQGNVAVAGEIIPPRAAAPRGRKNTKATDVVDQNATTAEPAQAIQTGGERAPPAEEPKKLTLDDVRNAAKGYIDKFTLAHAQIDLQFALEDAVGDGITAISKLDAENQEQLAKAVKAFDDAAAGKERYVSKKQQPGGAL